MGGIFGVASKSSCILDLFFGIDYHSHLGTRRGGMAVYDRKHGFDRVIRGIAQYYENGGKCNVIFHIVGQGDESENLKGLATSLNLEKNIIFHGSKFGAELDALYENADIGVDALGAHRKGL